MASDRGRGFGSWRRPTLREIFYAEDRPIPAPGTRRFQPPSARSRIPCGLRATLFRKLCRARISGQALAQPLSHQCFGAGIATMPNPRGLPVRHAGNAQSTRATGHASPPRAIICRASVCAATWRGVRKFPAAMRPIHPSPAHRLTLHFTRPSYSSHAERADCACQSPRVCHWGLASVPPRHRSPRI